MATDTREPQVIAVARVLELEVPCSWQEGVAIMMEAGEAAIQAGTGVAAETCLISTAGNVRLEPALASGALAPGVALPSMLAALLEGQAAPAELRALAIPGPG